MKLMTHTRAALLSFLCTGIAFAAGEGWSTDYEAAKKEAAGAKKSLLIDFTGSDWCGGCIRLKEEVFKHDTFKDGVKDKLVLLELDYPQDKSGQSEALQKQNEELLKKYVVEGFPTILLADEEGRPFAATGYKPGGPAEYVNHLDTLLAKRTIRDDGFAAAEKLEGAAKAKALVNVIEAMDLSDAMISSFYVSTVDAIKKADPEDSTGFVKKQAAKERLSKFDADLSALGERKDFEGALKLIDSTLQEGGMEPEDAQRVTLMRALIYADQGKFDEALKAVDEARKLAPESETAAQFDGLKKQLEAMKAHGKAAE